MEKANKNLNKMERKVENGFTAIPPMTTARVCSSPLFFVFAARKGTGSKMSGFFPNSYDLNGKKMISQRIFPRKSALS